jgi:hypothetical protein
MSNLLTKTDFIQGYLQCPTHTWLKVHKPDAVTKIPLTDFEQQIIEQGIEVEDWARKLFPDGVLVESFKQQAIADTLELLEQGSKTIFQATFEGDDLYSMVDILSWDEAKQHWVINEVKGTTSKDVKKEVHEQDATFQYITLKEAGLNVGQVNLIELDKEFIKDGPIDPKKLLKITDITDKVLELEQDIRLRIADAKRILARETAPPECDCIYRSRANQCPTFAYNHPDVPAYSVHDICRIGASKKKLREMIDNGWYSIDDIPHEFELSKTQSPQVHVTKTNETIIQQEAIANMLAELTYPLYFLDYETFPSAIPVFDGCFPFQQVPFQYSLHTLHEPGGEYVHTEFLHTENSNPMQALAEQLRNDIGNTGSVIVWNKKFEGMCNSDLANAIPELSEFLHGITNRFFDLMEPFSKQLYVHKDFKGSSSIKAVLPVLAAELNYKDLNISNGGMACSSWGQMVFDKHNNKEQIATDLLEYCKLDTWAMVRIWEELMKV